MTKTSLNKTVVPSGGRLKTIVNGLKDKVFNLSVLIYLYLIRLNNSVYAAQSDKIITVIKTLTQDLYGDFVYLSLGFATLFIVVHLVMVIFSSGNDQARNKHIKAIATAIIAWVVINLLTFFIAKIFNLTGQTTPSDIFNTGGYN